MNELDQETVERLTVEIMQVLKPHLEKEPKTRMLVYESLNALAVAAGTMIAGTMDPVALNFFNEALFTQMQSIVLDEAKKEPHT
jgi:hypothetical protein